MTRIGSQTIDWESSEKREGGWEVAWIGEDSGLPLWCLSGGLCVCVCVIMSVYI